MGKHFGNLQRLYGVTYYVLSPNELRPLKGIFNPGFANACRRYLQCGTPFLIGAAVSYFIYWEATETTKKSHRKDPELYKDDV